MNSDKPHHNFHTVFFVCIVVVVLLSGVPFYALFRSANTPFEIFSRRICSLLFSEPLMIDLQQWGSNIIPNIVKNSYPDFIWCFSWTILLCIVWEKQDSVLEKHLWIFSPAICCVCWELAQYHNIVGGTGAFEDVVAGIVATLSGWLAFSYRVRGGDLIM